MRAADVREGLQPDAQQAQPPSGSTHASGVRGAAAAAERAEHSGRRHVGDLHGLSDIGTGTTVPEDSRRPFGLDQHVEYERRWCAGRDEEMTVPDESGAVIDQRVRRDRDHAARVLRRHRDYALEDVGEDPDPRFTFANERTLLAWNRTALALIAAGVGATQLLELGSRALSLILALPLIALGCVLAIASYSHWETNERAMRLHLPLTHPPFARVLRLTIALVGVAAIVLGIVNAAG